VNGAQSSSEDTIIFDNHGRCEDAVIFDEAVGWIMCFEDPDLEPGDPYRDLEVRGRAFREWVTRSADHVRVLLEAMEQERRIHDLDARAHAEIQRLVELQAVTYASLTAEEIPTPAAQHTVQEEPLPARPWTRIAAAIAAIAILAGVVYYFTMQPAIYTTQIGERQQRLLSDGSLIELNTNSRVAVHFSPHARVVHLIQGEVFFRVTHDSRRPFTVTASDASIQVIGTQFDVRQTPQGIEVAVVSGRVHASAGQAPATVGKASEQVIPPSEKPRDVLVLSTGEVAEIVSGKVSKLPTRNVDDVMAWRQNLLVFFNDPLTKVVEEFNRYNPVQIRVEGAFAQEVRVSGKFGVRDSQAILQYAKTKHLLVIPDGNTWVIRPRQ
jgi:transmembrane sensor